MTVQVLLANAWMLTFGVGPLEWVWRSLTYLRVHPFRYLPVELLGELKPERSSI